jgi:hypothetical protein
MKNGDALVGHEKLETLIDEDEVQVHHIEEGALSTAIDKEDSPDKLFKEPAHLVRCGDRMAKAKVKDEKHRILLDLTTEEWELLDEDDKAERVDLYYVEKKKANKENQKGEKGEGSEGEVQEPVGGGEDQRQRISGKEKYNSRSKEKKRVYYDENKEQLKNKREGWSEQQKTAVKEQNRRSAAKYRMKKKKTTPLWRSKKRKTEDSEMRPAKKQREKKPTTTSSSGRKSQRPARYNAW